MAAWGQFGSLPPLELKGKCRTRKRSFVGDNFLGLLRQDLKSKKVDRAHALFPEPG